MGAVSQNYAEFKNARIKFCKEVLNEYCARHEINTERLLQYGQKPISKLHQPFLAITYCLYNEYEQPLYCLESIFRIYNYTANYLLKLANNMFSQSNIPFMEALAEIRDICYEKFNIIDSVVAQRAVINNRVLVTEDVKNQQLDLISKSLSIFCSQNNFNFDLIKSKSRNREISLLRHSFIYSIRKHFNIQYNIIGMFFERDHSSIINSYNTAADLLCVDKPFKRIVKFAELACKAAINDVEYWAKTAEPANI